MHEWEENILGSHEFYGGDLKGIIEKLDYLKDLGITGLYLSPISQSPSSHKYDTTDYFEIDPNFGTKEEFRNLVKEAHSRNIKIMLDAVFNHIGATSKQFKDVIEKGENSIYYNWFYINKWPVTDDQGKLKGENYKNFCEDMPKLNTENEEVIQHLLKVSRYWIEEFDVDGVFYDCGNNAAQRSPGFMQKALERQKNKKPDFLIFSEGDATTQSFVFPYADGCYDWLLSTPWNQDKGFPGIFNQITTIDDFDLIFRKEFPDSLLIKRKAADYDTRAHTSWDFKREKLGLSMVMTAYGFPHIWMGDEIGSDSELGPYPFVYDPENLKPLYARLIKMRQEILGNYAVLDRLANNTPLQIYSYIARGKKGSTLTIANLSPIAASASLNLSDTLFPEKITKWYEVMNDTNVVLNSQEPVTVNLEPWQSKVFVLNKSKNEIYTTLSEPVPIAITFQVNMKGIDTSHGGVSVVGNWSDWKEATELSLVKDNIYSGTIVFKTSGELQWRFANTSDVNDFDNYEYLSQECTKNYNRYITIPSKDTILNPVCFNSCAICAYNNDITFQVNMQNETISSSGVYIMGNWDNWTTAIRMDNTSNEIFSTTLSLTPGNRIDYKFINGNPAGNWGTYTWENFNGSCTDEWTNRFFIVPEKSTVLDPVCFGGCEGCVTNAVSVFFHRKIILYPNPADKSVTISGLPDKLLKLEILTVEGKICFQKQTNGCFDEIINIRHLNAGVYFIKIKNEEDVQILRLIKE